MPPKPEIRRPPFKPPVLRSPHWLNTLARTHAEAPSFPPGKISYRARPRKPCSVSVASVSLIHCRVVTKFSRGFSSFTACFHLRLFCFLFSFVNAIFRFLSRFFLSSSSTTGHRAFCAIGRSSSSRECVRLFDFMLLFLLFLDHLYGYRITPGTTVFSCVQMSGYFISSVFLFRFLSVINH